MKKLILILILLSLCINCESSQDIIPEPKKDEQVSVPVINDEIRKVYSEISTAKSDIDTAETDIDALDVRITALEAAAISSEKLVKAWINWDGTVAQASMIKDSYNVSGITDGGTGIYTIAWETDFASVNYTIAGAAGVYSGQSKGFVTINALAVGSATVWTVYDSGTLYDMNPNTVIATGDQ